MKLYDKLKVLVREHKKLFVFSVLLIVIFLSLFGTQIALYVKFMLGNDIIISVGSDDRDVNLIRGETEQISIDAEIHTNPFCRAECDYEFKDLSSGIMLESNSFQISPEQRVSKEFTIGAPQYGEGLMLYRFDLSCAGIRTFWCHTSAKPSSRSLLVTARYSQSADETAKKERLHGIYEDERELLGEMTGRVDAVSGIVDTTMMDDVVFDLYRDLESSISSWNAQKLDEFEGRLENIDMTEGFELLLSLEESAYRIVENHNQAYESMLQSYNRIEDMRNMTIYSADTISRLNSLVAEFNQVNISDYKDIKRRVDLTEIIVQSDQELQKLALVDIGLYYSVMCRTGLCYEYTPVELCSDITSAYTYYEELSTGDSFAAGELRQEMINELLANTTDQFILQNYESRPIENYTFNATSIRDAAGEFLPDPCADIDVLEPVYDAEPMNVPVPSPIMPDIPLTEPNLNCPVFGRQLKCGGDDYPVLLIHGHSFNEGLSAEYSLDDFSKIQARLEEEGYLNAGEITLLTSDEQVSWHLIPVPMVFRTSYYFDIFGESDNYVAVQTKSENIDTYAIRLNDLIYTVLHKTDREKVKIVAYSMGGLVSRRYIQIFGDSKVDQLIMIGTPNHGISEDIAGYCDWIGTDLECRDMASDSLFMNKLNRNTLSLPVTNIVGTGCNMKGSPGDGIVLESSGIIEDADNHIVEGTCRSTFEPLHIDLLDIDLYPEVYFIVRNALN